MAKSNKETIKTEQFFSAINPYIQINIPSPKETDIRGKEFVAFGDKNDYPSYLWSLYQEVPTLSSAINATADYVCGNEVICNVPRFEKTVNRKGENINDVFEKCAVDKVVFGGFYLNIIRDNAGNIAEIYHLDYRNVRSDKKNERFYYSEDWSKSYGRIKCLVYPKFVPTFNQTSSVLFCKGSKARETYTLPIYNSAIVSCEIERKINQYHLNSISNGFSASFMVNFNNGQPSDEIRNEIEKNLNEKFSGSENAGRIMVSFNADKDHQCEVTPFDIKDFGEKYNTLAKRSKEQIMTCFGTSGAIFGIMQENIGFNNQEFMSQFTLYNKTRVLPIQKEMIDTFDKVFGIEKSITIEPFTINFDEMEMSNSDNNLTEKTVE